MTRASMAFDLGWFELVLSPYEILPITQEKQIFWDNFLFYNELVCCLYSSESPHRGDSNDNTQRTIIVEKIKKTSLNYHHLLPDIASWLTLSDSI